MKELLLKHSDSWVLVSCRTCQTWYSSHFDEGKNVSALGACAPVVTLARTCMSHGATLKEKMLHRSSLAHHSLEQINDEYWDTIVLT